MVDTTFGENGSSSAAFHSRKIGSYADLGGVAIDADGSVYIAVSGTFGVSRDNPHIIAPTPRVKAPTVECFVSGDHRHPGSSSYHTGARTVGTS